MKVYISFYIISMNILLFFEKNCSFEKFFIYMTKCVDFYSNLTTRRLILKISASGSHLPCVLRKVVLKPQKRNLACLVEQEINEVVRCRWYYLLCGLENSNYTSVGVCFRKEKIDGD